MEEILAQFPETIKVEPSYRSFIYQPERVSINSRQSLKNASLAGVLYQSNYYFQFESELRSPLLRIKKAELLRATIPNPVTNIPLTQGVFFYYRIPALNAPDDFAPDYISLRDEPLDYLHMVRLLPQTTYSPDDYQEDAFDYAFNRTFQDYEDLVTELNKAAKDDPDFNRGFWMPNTEYPPKSYIIDPDDPQERLYYTAAGSEGTADFNTDGAWVLAGLTPFVKNDITFTYNETLNKIVVQGKNFATATPQYYYLPVGYNDPALAQFVEIIQGQIGADKFPINLPYTLNRRLGYLFSGIDLDLFGFDDNVDAVLTQITFPKPNWSVTAVPPDYQPLLPNYTAEGYPDLVNTANVFVYCDFVGGSTQDNNADERLLAVIPMNASNLGVAFGESKIVCPLTKVSENIYKILITLRTDTGEPFYLPTNAYVNLEIKLTYE